MKTLTQVYLPVSIEIYKTLKLMSKQKPVEVRFGRNQMLIFTSDIEEDVISSNHCMGAFKNPLFDYGFNGEADEELAF